MPHDGRLWLVFLNSFHLETIMSAREPIFTRQEQGVVYWFSRYWERIPEFKNKRLYDIQMRFPDASMVDTVTGADEAIEFEYALSSYNHHKAADGKRLRDYDSLYIVYWDQDDDEDELRERIKRHFTGKVKFVRLSDYFSPSIQRESACLGAYWKFCSRKHFGWAKKVYPLKRIVEDTTALAEKGVFEPLEVTRLYRTIGFNRIGSDFIECDHWRTIHLFTTTTRFHRDMIPCKLFVKPAGCQYFWGYFEIKHAFVINKVSVSVKDYFRNFYFYPFAHSDHTCFVYSDFRELSHTHRDDPGVRLFAYLANKVRLDVRGSMVIPDKHIREIDRLIEQGGKKQ